MLKRNEFLWLFLTKGFDEKCKKTELALNLIEKQYFGEKKTFSLHYSRIATPRTSKKLSFFNGTLRP